MAGIFSHQMTAQAPLIWCSVLQAILGWLCEERGDDKLEAKPGSRIPNQKR